MTQTSRNRLIELISNPPAGSKLAAAKEFGVDLTLLVENLEHTVTERIERLSSVASFLEEMRSAGRRLR